MDPIIHSHPGHLRRDGLVQWMRSAIALAQAQPQDTWVSRAMALAGVPVQIYVDDPALAAVYFSRLRGAAVRAAPADRIYVLSGRCTSWGPVPKWDDLDCPPVCFQEIVEEAGLRAAYPLIPRFWQFFDPRSRIGVQLSASPSDLPKWDSAAPLRRHLHWLLESRGLRLTHAATLGLHGRGLLLLGPGGTGKSGTTLAGLAEGLSTVGDDYVAIGGGEAPFARALYQILKQDHEGIARIPGLSKMSAHLVTNWQGKIEFNPDEIFPGAMVEELPLGAVLLPTIVHVAVPAMHAVTPAAAMLALLSSNLHQYLGEKEAGMALFARLLRRLPCYRLHLSDDATRNGKLLRRFLQHLPSLPQSARSAHVDAESATP
jgi:hypothetical protein